MKSIKFTDNELEFLRNHYQVELKEAQNYVSQIKDILSKVGVSKRPAVEIPAEEEVNEVKKRGRKPGNKKIVDKPVPKKRGRKPKALSTETKPEPEKTVAEVVKAKVKPGKKLIEAKTATAKQSRKSNGVSAKSKPAPQSLVAKSATKETKPSLKKEAEKRLKKKSSKSRSTRGNVFLTPLSKPLKKKEPVAESPTDTVLSQPDSPNE